MAAAALSCQRLKITRISLGPTCGAGSGTHMDAPAHVVPGGVAIEQLDLDTLFSDCVVIDVSAQADENYVIAPNVVDEFEKEHGRIQSRSFVIFYTGWDKYWEDTDKYRNGFLFPNVHVSTAEMLLPSVAPAVTVPA